jgi:siroheme synthase-like protein
MRTHAVFLRLDGRRCVIVGGDATAERKAECCLEAGATVVVIAPSVSPGLARLHDVGRLARVARGYRQGDLHGAFLAYAVERDPAVLAALREEAERERVLLNVADVPNACTFFAPAIVLRGDLQIAIGTGGNSPTLAARLRRDLDGALGPEYAPYVAILGAVRAALPGARRAEVMERLVASELLALVRRGEGRAVDALLAEVAGDACTLGRLGIALGGEG